VYNPKYDDSSLIVTKRTDMAQKHDMTAPKMTRVTVRVPKTTLDQINDWVDTLGVRRSHFLGIALVSGVRSLIHASALEMSLAAGESVQPDTGPPGKAAVPGQEPADPSALAQTVESLRAEVEALQAEIADLRDQLQAQRASSKRHP
jgi:cell division protein FtsB